MRLKLLIVFLLTFTPHVGFAYYVCRPCCNRLQLPGWWGSAEYLYLWRKERFYPPLVTTNPVNPPVLGDPQTVVLFGNESVGGVPKSGVRGDWGFWLTPCMGFGISGFALGHEEVNFSIAGSDAGLPILGRPFFNTALGIQEATLISFPALAINGSIDIETNNGLWGLDLYARRNFFRTCCFKFDLLAGFQYTRIIDSVGINSRSTGIIPFTVHIFDHFACANDFYGGLAGALAEWRSKNWALSVVGKLGIGNMYEQTKIKGETTVHFGNIPVAHTDVGLLAKPSNIGLHTVNHFDIVPQLNADIQLRIWGHMWLKLGYMGMYWQSVALAGEQIDLNINPAQLPGFPDGPPFFNDVNTSFWIHGITAGIHICY